MRNNPWNDWHKLWRAGTMIGETMSAAHKVVGHRGETIGDALRDPLGADHAELGRMVSEKATAFGAAGTSLTLDLFAMQADMRKQASAMTAMMFGQVPSPAGARAMTARGQRIGRAALASSVRALTPIHRAATANERRLGRGKKR